MGNIKEDDEANYSIHSIDTRDENKIEEEKEEL